MADKITLALFGVFCFMAGFMAASMYTWWAISTRRRGVKLLDGTTWFVPMSEEHLNRESAMTAAPSHGAGREER